jgi:hypothetical protein
MRDCFRFYLSAATLLIFLSTASYAQNNWAAAYSVTNETAFIDAVRQTSDGGFVLTGFITVSNSFDLWLLKLNSDGTIQWQKTFGGDQDDYGFSVEQTQDGGYIVAGQTLSFGAGSNDTWILKFDQNGNVQWQETLGQSQTDFALSIKQISDGFIVAGGTYPSSLPPLDFWLIKLDLSGNVIWQKTYGGTGDEYTYSVNLTFDGGFIISGASDSFGSGFYDLWILKLDSAGGIQWQKTYSTGTNIDLFPAREIQQTLDGGFIAASTSSSRTTQTIVDIVVLKLDSSGKIQWQKSYGIDHLESTASIQQTSDGGFIVGGQTSSNGADAFLLLRLDPNGNIIWQKEYQGNDSENLMTLEKTSDGGFIAAGTNPKRAIPTESWIVKVDDAGEIDPACPFVTNTNAVAVDASLTEFSTAVSPVDTAYIAANTTANINTGPASYSQQCVDTCVFCDSFGDGVLAANWTYVKPAWSESGGNLIGSPIHKSAIAIASPAFNGSDVCSVQATLQSNGGSQNRVSLFTHYLDKRNNIEVILDEEADKVIVKQRLNGKISSKAKATFPIDPNIPYDVLVSYDGSLLSVSINGVSILTLAPIGNLPSATVGFKSTNTDAFFGDIHVD